MRTRTMLWTWGSGQAEGAAAGEVAGRHLVSEHLFGNRQEL